MIDKCKYSGATSPCVLAVESGRYRGNDALIRVKLGLMRSLKTRLLSSIP